MSDAASKEARRRRLLGLPASDEPVATPVVEPTVEPVVEPGAEAAPAPSGQSRRDRLLGLKPEPVVAAKPAPVPAVVPAPVAAPVVVVKKAGPKPKVAAPYEGDPAMPWGYYEQIDKGATPEAAQAYVDALPTFGTVRELQDAAASQPKSSTVGEPGTPTGPVYGPPEREMERAVLPKPTAKELAAAEVQVAAPSPNPIPLPSRLPGGVFKKKLEPIQKNIGITPETLVARAALQPDKRAAAEELINDVGLRNAMGVAELAPLADLGLALVNASDPQYESYYRYRISKANKRREPGQKFEDLPTDVADKERAKVREDAIADLALLKTVGMWGPKGFMPADRDPTSVIDAFKPTAEVIGVNAEGEVVPRVQSMASYALEMGTMGIEYPIISTGLPSALLRGMFGENPEADQPTYNYGQIAGITVPFSPESIRARRDVLGAKQEADVEGWARRTYRSVGEAIGAPAPLVDATEYVAGKAINFNVGTSAFVASLLIHDPITATVKVAKLAGVPIFLSKTEKLAREARKASLVAEKSAKESADFGGLIARNASESEVVERIEQGAKVADEMVKPLTQSAKDAVADSARVRVHAEKAAVEAQQAQGVLYSEGGARRSGVATSEIEAAERAFVPPKRAADMPRVQYHATTWDRTDAIDRGGLLLPTNETVKTAIHTVPSISSADIPSRALNYGPAVYEVRLREDARFLPFDMTRDVRKGEVLSDAIGRASKKALSEGYAGLRVKGFNDIVGNQILDPSAVESVRLMNPGDAGMARSAVEKKHVGWRYSQADEPAPGTLYSSAAEASAADAAALSEIAAYNKTIREAPVGKVDINRNRPMPGNIPYQPKNHYRVVGKEGLADLETSGVVRARQGTKAGYESAYFNEGSALGRYWGDVVIEVAPTPKMRRAANGYQVADNVNPITKADAIRIWVRNAGTAHYDIAFDNINDVVSRQFRSASGAERAAAGAAPGSALPALRRFPRRADPRILEIVPESGAPAIRVLRKVSDIAKAEGDHGLAAIARHLADNGALDDVVVTRMSPSRAEFLNAKGTYDSTFHGIEIAESGSIETIVHEAVHAATSRALFHRELLSAAGQRAAKNLEALFEAVKDAHLARIAPRTDGSYGFKNVHEFVAEAFSNPEFQAQLRRIQVSVVDGRYVIQTGGGGRPQTMWGEFVDQVGRLMGFSDADALGHAIGNADVLMKEAGSINAMNVHGAGRFKRPDSLYSRAPGTPPRPVQYSATPMRGSLDGAIKAEQKARVHRASSQHAALGLSEGLRNVARLATSVGGKPAVLTPAEAAAYAERLFDSASTTARELALGAEEAIAPAGSKGAIRALVESVMAAPPTPATQALVSAVEAADAARRMFTGERLEKALRAVTPRVDKAFRDVMQAGVAVTPAQRAAFRDAAVLELEGTLIGKNSLARAQAAIDKVLATAPVDQITPQMMGDVDEVMRTYATEAAEATRRANPLRSSAPSILLGESASRFRGVKDNPTLLRGLKNGLVRSVKLVFGGGNEMAPWAKEGLSKEAREWTLAAVRRFDAIAGDVSQLKSADEAAAYLHGVAAPANRGLVTDGMDRFDVFTNLVTVDRKSVDEYLDALMATEMKPKNLAEQINGAGVAGRPEQAGAQYPFWMEVQAAIEAARAGKIDAAGFMERLHKVAKPYTRNGEVPEAWTRITTGWIAAQAENVVLLNKGFGDGIVFTQQDLKAIQALGDGKFDSDTMRALDPANMVERAVSSNRMVGVGGLKGRTEKVGVLTVQVGGADAVAGARKHARAAERVGVYNAVMADQIYVPRLVREQMAGAIARTFTPQTYGGNNMLGVWKLAVTRGVLASKPGYILNNIPGDTEQIMIATGMRVALKTAVRAEGASVASILVTALPSMAGHAARAAVGDVAGPVVQSVVQGGVDFGLGLFLAATAGKNKGAVARLIHAGGEVGEKLAGKVANMLGMGATRVEISTIMDGGDKLVTIGDKVWKASELRRIAIETGVYDSFDRAELVQSVNGLNKLFRVPAEGVSSIAETVSLRKRLALYTVLIEEGMHPKAAGRAVVDALFDYRATLSEGEKHWLRQVLLPFWSWQKNMNRLVINSVASPMGAYRLKVTHQVGEKAKEMMAEAPTTEGDDVGILNTFMLADEVVHYERFRRFRELAEAINPQITPENWNAIILSSNPVVPVSMEWAQDPTIPEADRLTFRDVEVMRAYLSPWYTESMARSYLRDRAQVRMKHPVTTDGKVVPTETWHAVAPHSGLAGAMEWFSMVAAGTLAAGALGIKTVGGPGDWLSMQTPGEALSPLLNPKNAPQLGSLIAVMDPRGRSPQRVAEVIPKTVDAIQDSVAGFLLRSGVADGDWDNATPGVLINDKSGTVRYAYTPEIAALIGSLPGIADLNRKALSYEGSKGEAYAPDVARILLQSFGFSAPTVENMAGLKEVGERNAWVKKNLPQYSISRGDDAERLITTEAAPK